MTTILEKACIKKHTFYKASSAKIVMKKMEKKYNRRFKIYPCNYCSHWHVARNQANKKRKKKKHHIMKDASINYKHICLLDDPWYSDKGTPVLHTNVIYLKSSRELITYRCANCNLVWKINKW